MKYVSLALLALSITASPAFAAGQAAPNASHADHAHANHAPAKLAENSKAFAGFDLNKDGKLSTTELAKHPMAGHMSMVDADKDGSLDAAEFAAFEKM
jgi:hypothetical protein